MTRFTMDGRFMKVTCFDNPAEFAARVQPMLLESEAENNLLLGVIGRFTTSPAPPDRLLCAVEDAGRVVAAASMTSPHPIVLTRMDLPAVKALVQFLRARGIVVPGVIGAVETTDRFVGEWQDGSTSTVKLKVSLRIYQTEDVTPVATVPGMLRWPRDDERELLMSWTRSFGEEIGEPHRDVAGSLDQRLGDRSLFVWDDNGPVTMAGWAGPTPHGVRINAVYTPVSLRRRGYATACVAALTRRMLDSGRRFCFLFTDLNNPTSNSIYQKIGYRPVCDWRAYDFVQVNDRETT